MATYHCDAGANMTGGSTQRTCHYGGNWDGNEPSCYGEYDIISHVPMVISVSACLIAVKVEIEVKFDPINRPTSSHTEDY